MTLGASFQDLKSSPSGFEERPAMRDFNLQAKRSSNVVLFKRSAQLFWLVRVVRVKIEY